MADSNKTLQPDLNQWWTVLNPLSH